MRRMHKAKHKPKKEQSTIRLYMEGQKADTTTAGTVLVTREKFPFIGRTRTILDEADFQGGLDWMIPGEAVIPSNWLSTTTGRCCWTCTPPTTKAGTSLSFPNFPSPATKSQRQTKKEDADECG